MGLGNQNNRKRDRKKRDDPTMASYNWHGQLTRMTGWRGFLTVRNLVVVDVGWKRRFSVFDVHMQIRIFNLLIYYTFSVHVRVSRPPLSLTPFLFCYTMTELFSINYKLWEEYTLHIHSLVQLYHGMKKVNHYRRK